MKVKFQEVYLILHNVRSAYNVGSVFRTADAAGVAKIYLCGYTPTPENAKVIKTSLGAESSVSWQQRAQAWRLIDELRSKGVNIIALEQTETSQDYKKLKPKFPLAVIIGHELAGVENSLLKRADSIWHIPMRGQKESLNVAVATGIFLYSLSK